MADLVEGAVAETVPDLGDGGSVDAPKSLADTVRAAFAEHVDENGTEKQKPAADAKPTQVTVGRAADGKFAKADGTADPAAADKGAAAAVETPATQVQTQAPSKAPDGWSAAAKAEWDKLPPTVQADIARREAEVHKGFTKQDDERNFGREMQKTVAPYLATIQAEGGNPVLAVQTLLNTAHILRHANPAQKAQHFAQIARQYGVDLRHVAGVLTAPATPPDPIQAAIDARLAPLQQKLAAFEGARTAEQEQAQAQQQAVLATEITAFGADPKNTHFEQVKPAMAALLSTGAANDLRDAYDKAVWSDPTIRSTLLLQQQNAAEEERKATIRAKTEAAQRASGSVPGGPGATAIVAAAVKRSLRDEVTANFHAAAGR